MSTAPAGRAAANPVLTPRAAAIESLPACARLDARDVLSLLAISKSTLLRRIEDGRVPPPISNEVQLRWSAGAIRDFLRGEAA